MKVILLGATGNAGKAIAKELVNIGYNTTVVVRSLKKANEIGSICKHHKIITMTDPKQLEGICNGFDIVISTLGKSVSFNDKSKTSFTQIDLEINTWILQEAIKSQVKKFVYLSALHSEKYPHLEYFRTHHEFSEKLKSSGLNYSIIKPPAIFSSFLDLISMAKQGKLVTIGDGSHFTNPIHESDLAKISVGSIQLTNATLEVGGPEKLSRKEVNTIIQQIVNPAKKVRSLPVWIVKLMLPLLRLIDKSTHSKFAFFIEVTQNDCVGPLTGEKRLSDYIKANLYS